MELYVNTFIEHNTEFFQYLFLSSKVLKAIFTTEIEFRF